MPDKSLHNKVNKALLPKEGRIIEEAESSQPRVGHVPIDDSPKRDFIISVFLFYSELIYTIGGNMKKKTLTNILSDVCMIVYSSSPPPSATSVLHITAIYLIG